MSYSKVPSAMSSPGALGRRPRASALRHVLVLSLSAASGALDRWAARIALPTPAAERSPAAALEFYAQSGAPEGALYVDGRLVGWIEGVQRL